ncbi:transcriptional regulator swi6, partial [Tulasnella sp. 427]
MSASTAATPVPAMTPAPAPAAPASAGPVSKPPTPAGGTLTPIAVTPSSNTGARVYNAIYSSVQVYECMVRNVAVMRRRVDSYVNATQILKVAGIDKGRRTKILEKEILPGRHEIVQGGYGKYQGTWIPLERGREVATQFGVLPLLQPLFDYVPPTATMPSMVGLRPPPTLFYPPGTTFPAYSLGAQALQLTYPPAPGAALSILQQGRSAGLFTPTTATFSALPPGFQFSHMGYGIPTTLPGQPTQPSIISVTPTPKASIAEVRTGSATPSAATPGARPSPVPANSKESQTGQKRPRSNEDAREAKTSKSSKSKQAPGASGGSSGNVPRTGEDRMSKRQRLEAQRSEAMDLTVDDTPLTSSQQISDTQGTIVGSQATIPDSQASIEPAPSSPLPVVEPNGIHPIPLHAFTLNKPISDLPDAKARVSSKPPQRTRPLGPGDSEPQSPLKSPQYRAILLAIVSDEPASSI